MTCMRKFLLGALLVFACSGVAAQSVQMPDFKRLERELRLKPEQKAQYDVATTALKRSLIASASTLMELKSQLGDELSKSVPDFRALWDRQRKAYELNEPIYRETLEEWSRLYAQLEDKQVIVAKRFLREALEGATASLR